MPKKSKTVCKSYTKYSHSQKRNLNKKAKKTKEIIHAKNQSMRLKRRGGNLTSKETLCSCDEVFNLCCKRQLHIVKPFEMHSKWKRSTMSGKDATYVSRTGGLVRGAGVRTSTSVLDAEAVWEPAGVTDAFLVLFLNLRMKRQRCILLWGGISCYLVVHDTMEDIDEEALQRVQNGEDIRHDGGFLVHVQQTKRPSQAEENNQNNRSLHPRSKQK